MTNENYFSRIDYFKQLQCNEIIKAEFGSIVKSFKVISITSFIVVLGLFFIHEDSKIDDNRRFEKQIEEKEFIHAAFDIGIRFIIPFIFIFLYKFEGSNTIFSWLGKFCYIFLFLVASGYYILFFLKSFAIPYPPLLLIVLFGIIIVFGMLGNHPKCPMIIKKAFKIISFAFISIFTIENSNNFSIWILLCCAAIMDAFSVLCPWGALNIFFRLLKTKKEKPPQEFVYPLNTVIDKEESEISNFSDINVIEIDVTETNLGCGDIFLIPLLIGNVSIQQDLTVTFACYLAVLMGIALTFTCFKVFNRETIPALPIPVFLGIIFYYFTNNYGTILMNNIAMHQFVV